MFNNVSMMDIFLKIIPNALKNCKRKKTSRGRYLNMQSIISSIRVEVRVWSFSWWFKNFAFALGFVDFSDKMGIFFISRDYSEIINDIIDELQSRQTEFFKCG